ncbi:hypothetical protein CF54_39885 [Streptomyces sp. Tu 6176]|nr:hypothetical protein CF54_39885 [Streptomyces sp. Tu 6176]
MSLGESFTLTPDEFKNVWERLTPYLPPNLRKIETHRWGLRCEFAPFTGQEEEPDCSPSFYEDPRLRYVGESEDMVEYRLRQAARTIVSDLYDQARTQWRDAAYVADLRSVVRDAPERWRAYERAAKALDSAYAYLRAPEASREWPAAISRLVDAQEHALATAAAFDERAVDIADVHYKHLYAELGQDQALKKAGYPEATAWHVGDGFDGYFRNGLADKVSCLIKEQEAHVAKVSRLAGTVAV